MVVIGYGELLTSELLPAFVVAKMACCLKLNVSEITALQVSVGPFPECFSYVEVLEIIVKLYTNLRRTTVMFHLRNADVLHLTTLDIVWRPTFHWGKPIQPRKVMCDPIQP